MRLSLRQIPIMLMGVLSVGYVLARPGLSTRVPHLAILEFPVGAMVIALLLWAALGHRRPDDVAPWRRHEQIVRPLPDPALVPYEGTLERWLETGDAPERVALVLARAATSDAAEGTRIAAALSAELSAATSRRKRESLLHDRLRQGVRQT